MRTLLSVLLTLSVLSAAAQQPTQSQPAAPAQTAAPSSPQAPSSPPSGAPGDDQSFTLRTQSSVVLVPATVQTKKGAMIYQLKPEQFVVEDNGARQAIHLDEDTDSLGLSLVVVVQCSRGAGWEFTKLDGLGTMIQGLVGGAPREVAVVTYESAPLLLEKFSSSMDALSRGLAQLTPCDGDGAATLDAVDYAAKLLAARDDHNRHAILLISETRDHGSASKPAAVISELGRSNIVVDSVAFGPGKTEVLNDLKYGGVTSPIGLLVMAMQALRKNTAKELAALSGGEYINFSTQHGFDDGLHQLTNHIHNYYLLSFQPHGPAGEPPTPGMHRIRVSVPDYPDARIRFRESYFTGQLDSTTGGDQVSAPM